MNSPPGDEPNDAEVSGLEPFIPYGRQQIDEDDIQAVVEVLRSDWITTGPAVDAFEAAMAAFTGAGHAVAVSSGTAALHCAMHAIDLKPGDEVIVPAITFAATANCVLYAGAQPVFADVDPNTLLIDPAAVAQLINPRTRAVITMDYAGQPCDYAALRAITEQAGITLVADACHAIGGRYRGQAVGTLADITTLSFHPVKHITTGEGGMVLSHRAEVAERARCFRNHGITTDHRQRAQAGAWYYEMQTLGFNYRASDLQCALGQSQLRKLPGWIQQRQHLAAMYRQALEGLPGVTPLLESPGIHHAYHLFVVKLPADQRQSVFAAMRNRSIGVNVHYQPVYQHPYYRDTLGFAQSQCPNAEKAFEQILSLPMYPGLGHDQVDRVVECLRQAVVSPA